MKDDRFYLRHILECIRRIEADTSPGRDEFLKSHTLQDAVLRNLQVLSESTQRISSDTKILRPEIEWRSISAFRNVLVHDYLGIDLDRIWEITQNEIQALKVAVDNLLVG